MSPLKMLLYQESDRGDVVASNNINFTFIVRLVGRSRLHFHPQPDPRFLFHPYPFSFSFFSFLIFLMYFIVLKVFYSIFFWPVYQCSFFLVFLHNFFYIYGIFSFRMSYLTFFKVCLCRFIDKEK